MDFLQICWTPKIQALQHNWGIICQAAKRRIRIVIHSSNPSHRDSYPASRAFPFAQLFLSYKWISFLRKRGAASVGDQRLEILVFFKLVDNTDWFTTVRRIGKLTFRALALRQSESQQRASARNVSFPIRLTVRVNIHLSTSLIKPNICLTRERLCMNQVSSLLSMRWMLLGYSFDPRLNQVIRLGKSSFHFGF